MRLIFRVSTLYAFYGTQVHYHGHTNLSPGSILCHMNSVHNPSHYLLKFHFNILLPSLLRCEKWYLPWSLLWPKFMYTFLLFLMCVMHPVQLILCLINILIILGKGYKLSNFSLCNLATPISDTIIFLSTLFHSFFSVGDIYTITKQDVKLQFCVFQTSHMKTTNKIIKHNPTEWKQTSLTLICIWSLSECNFIIVSKYMY